jgi:hypothetical protein
LSTEEKWQLQGPALSTVVIEVMMSERASDRSLDADARRDDALMIGRIGDHR